MPPGSSMLGGVGCSRSVAGEDMGRSWARAADEGRADRSASTWPGRKVDVQGRTQGGTWPTPLGSQSLHTEPGDERNGQVA
jgi:hypothetical protein